MFALMADAESPGTIFELLYTMLPENAQARIMYDNACNAEHYFLNREPEFTKNLEFYVDEFHFAGHRQCCRAYNTGVPLQCAYQQCARNAFVARVHCNRVA
jgi:hypothetical protein